MTDAIEGTEKNKIVERSIHPLDDSEAMEKALYDLGFGPILQRPYLQRLKDIRLLGTMKYVVLLEHNYSRYEHSIAVAYLTSIATKSLGLSNLCVKVAVLAALLHDVGHVAMSHGAEVFLLQRQGRFHEGHTRRIVDKLLKELSTESDRDLAPLVQLANDLLSGLLSISSYRKHPDGKDSIDDDEIDIMNALTTGSMSIDMIDGVTRSARSIGLAHPEPSALISALRRSKRELMVTADAWPTVWELFELERRIYDEYIYSKAGITAEAMLTRALDLTFPKISPTFEEQDAQDSYYSLVNDFLTLTDRSVILKIQEHAVANDILQKLEKRSLFMSLANITPDVHSEILEYMGSGYGVVSDERKVIVETALASHLGLNPSCVIFHSTIRKVFRFKEAEALRLFSEEVPFLKVRTRSFSEIRRQFKTARTSRTLFDVFLPQIKPEDLRTFTLPPPVLTKTPATYSPISKRFRMGAERKNGAVPTPQSVIEFLVTWAVRDISDTLLDPACGDGAFLQAAWNRLALLGASSEALGQITGVERQPGLWQELRDPWQERMIRKDFFEIKPGEYGLQPIDAIIGNPPYVRAHRFKGREREIALQAGNEVLNQFLSDNTKLPQGSNSWAPFLLHACAFLRPSGRLAVVLPTELLTADYARPIREFLKKRFRSLSFVLFQKRIFEEQQDALLLLADSTGTPGIYRADVDDIEKLDKALARMSSAPQLSNEWLAGKWTALLTSQRILDLLDSLITRNVVIPFGDIVSIKIGLVTGNSTFFTLTPKEVKKAHLKDEWLIPVITKANQVQGAVFTRIDLDELRQTDTKYLLLRIPPDTDLTLDPDLQQYIEEGRLQGIHSYQKCRTRWPWYTVPYSQVPDMFLTYMSGKRCRICLNEAQINCTNTIHRVFLKHKELGPACAASFYSSLTGLSVELAGRGYGGGLIKLEPSDAKILLMPDLEKLRGSILDNIASFLPVVNSKLKTQPLDRVFEEIDRHILVESLGLSDGECTMLQEEYMRLQDRRMNRAQRNEAIHSGREGQ